MRAQIDSREPPRCCSNLVAKHLFSPKDFIFYLRLGYEKMDCVYPVYINSKKIVAQGNS
ncbi:hypothetical protein C1H46_040320 [Malus baccata]|uniref:Uncharacterized protein n=1 Tax=Malus baccata TaxID=106549 RepID=A0A540KIV0_MALBA|nr:hypothetical protein C1H46_040320 [Malus baccata]